MNVWLVWLVFLSKWHLHPKQDLFLFTSSHSIRHLFLFSFSRPDKDMDVTLDKCPGYNLYIGGYVARRVVAELVRVHVFATRLSFYVSLSLRSSWREISRFVGLRRTQALKNCRITHIVSVLDWEFKDDAPLIRGYQHLHIPVDDVEDENLLEWFPRSNDFIREALKDQEGQSASHDGTTEGMDEKFSGVYIHW